MRECPELIGRVGCNDSAEPHIAFDWPLARHARSIDQLYLPALDRVWRHDRGDAIQNLPPETHGFCRQAATLVARNLTDAIDGFLLNHRSAW